ncbi:Recombinase [Erythrobacter dokdonensis DSW-74]|uniref:Recombinase n=1 Tax=Erythrobacter dokdonensis DSW-74 TaxID=1300349 RepID=A0A1A7BGY6_9SPHN|nr:Recombinase [Erythrobacter dokdonensis DSW-74]
MRTVLYARYSDDLQNPKSVEDQLAELRDRCKREGWTIVHEYWDERKRGSAGLGKEARPGMHALLDRISEGDIDQILVEATDRLARHSGDSGKIREIADVHGTVISTLSGGPVGDLEFYLKGWIDADFSKQLGAKVTRGQKGAVRDGRAPAGVPYGYRNCHRAGDDGRIRLGIREIIEEQAQILRRIYQEYADGMSPNQIARRLNNENVVGPRNGVWKANSISGDHKRKNGILQNRMYIGDLIYGRSRKVRDPKTRKTLIKPVPEEEWTICHSEHWRIIPQPLWDAVQARRELYSGRSFSRQQRPKRLLSGLAVCGCCGSQWIVVGKERWGCSSNRNGRGCINKGTITTSQFEARVLNGLQQRMLDPALVAVFVKEYHATAAQRNSEHNRHRAGLESKLAAATQKIERLVEAIANGGAEFVEVKQALIEAKERRVLLERELAELEALPAVTLHPRIADTYRAEVQKLAQALTSDEDTTLHARRIIRSLIDQVIVTPREAERGVNIEVSGRLASILALATGEEVPVSLYAAGGAGEGIRTLDPNLGKVVLYP